MKHIYDLEISIDTGKAIPAVGELCDNLNAGLASFGVDEKLSIRAPIQRGEITSDRSLSNEEIDKMRLIVLEQYAKSFPAWNVQVTMIRRQSGNVQQSVIQ